jgi:hypothetical protein
LGDCTESFDYNAAQAAAVAWFATLEGGAGVDSKSVATVTAACRAYVTELRKGHRETAAHDAEKCFERTVFEHPLGGSVRMIEKHYGHLVASAARARLAKVPML